MLYPTELITNRKCPVFERRTFYGKYEEFLDVSCGQPGYELYQYLAEHTDYDLNYVWDTVLRAGNMADIKERMQLNYILPTRIRLPNLKEVPRVALFMHIYFIELVEYCRKYAASMPLYADIYLTTDTEEKKLVLEDAFRDFGGRKVKVLVAENQGREVSAHLVELKPFVSEYDFICFAHDKKTTHLKPYMKGESFSYHCYENVLASPAYVENVIATFQDNPRLGLLVPPTPIHSDFYIVQGNEWQKNFDNVCILADRLKLSVNIEKEKPPISPLGGIYWYRTEALKPLFDAGFQYKDFPQEPIRETDGTIMHAIERLYPFVAQQYGFYTGWVLSDIFSKMELTNLNKILWDFNRILLSKFGQNSRYVHMNLLSQGDYATLALDLRELSMQMAEKEKMVKLLSAQVTEKEQALQMLLTQLSEKEQALQMLLTQLSEKEQAVQTLWVNVAEKEQAKEGLRLQLDQVTKDLEMSRTEIANYIQSTSWKVTKPIRIIKDMLRSFRR
jgi:rhamnosyltransferase